MSGFQMMGSKYPFVSLPSASPSRKLLENCKDWLGSFKKIYLSIDTDDKAEKFAISLMNLFPGRVYRVPHDVFKDANDFLMADAVRVSLGLGSMPNCLHQTTSMPQKKTSLICCMIPLTTLIFLQGLKD
jgi:hypothetical protein